MEMYSNISEHGNTESYLIQGTPSNIHSKNQFLERDKVMYNEGAPEFIADQGWYNATTPSYGYYCTGFESPGEWEDHQRIFVMDGPDIQYPGAETESFPYVYYTPSYEYAQSQYNPYNPYIPGGAMIGADGPIVGVQQYYTLPQYQNPVSSLSYMPVVIQPDVTWNSSIDLIGTGSSIASGGRGLKPNIPSTSSFPRNPMKQASNQSNALSRVSEGRRPHVRPNKQTPTHGNVPSAGFPGPASNVSKGRSSGSIQTIDHLSNEKVLSRHHQPKGLFDFRPQGRGVMDKIRPWVQGRAQNNVSGSPSVLAEQNRGPRTNEPKNQLAVKAYTTQVGDSNAQGNIIIHTDQYNKDDFPVDYMSAKFFVIKSYSEDDVHKSIKYGVWSSTPHGNKKLESAYADAQKKTAGKPEGCPIFLFFSVNASGQFCGVAEMTGPVDFHRDMDFWQQDKWSGSFPVKWHIIKDVPNTSLRHIILENNENKPVTNSRDTQEIMYKQGPEMLKIFKNHTSKASLLDDFMYYEKRQKIVQEEKVRFTVQSFENPFVTAFHPPLKIDTVVEPPLNRDGEITKEKDPVVKEKAGTQGPSSRSVVRDTSIEKEKAEIVAADGEDIVPNLKIGSLTINPKQTDPTQLASSASAHKDSVGTVTVGSVPIKVNGFAESTDLLTAGTVPLDPKTLHLEKGDAVA